MCRYEISDPFHGASFARVARRCEIPGAVVRPSARCLRTQTAIGGGQNASRDWASWDCIGSRFLSLTHKNRRSDDQQQRPSPFGHGSNSL